MKERAHTTKLMKTMRVELPRCHLIKHADRFTIGVPDFTCTWNGFTSWIEDKELEFTQSVHDELGPGQLETCMALEREGQHCWIVCFQKGRRSELGRTIIYRPSKLRNMLGPAYPQLCPARYAGTGVDVETLWRTGAICSAGFDCKLVTELITLTHRR